MGADPAAAERAIAAFLVAIGHPSDSDPELRETPARVARTFCSELLGGYDIDVEALFAAPKSSASETGDDGIVVVRDVRIQTLCPHHLLPGLGVASIAYVPGGRLLGIGALAQLVDAYARRLSLQEHIGRQVVDALMTLGQARGAYCRLDLQHTCLSCRGARQSTAVVTTEARAGALATPESSHRLRDLLGLRSSPAP
jgi:GTP cyclohydrolase IA